MRQKEGVYLIGSHEHGWYKIGRTNNPKSRLDALQTACPFALELVHFVACELQRAEHQLSRQLEGRLHCLFSDNRIRGECFSLNQDEVGEAIYALHHSGLTRTGAVISTPPLPMNPACSDGSQPISHTTVQ